jgi:hypothetical protein
MKWCLVGSILVLGGTALVADGVPATATDGKGEAAWVGNYTAARAAAHASGKPMLVVFR